MRAGPFILKFTTWLPSSKFQQDFFPPSFEIVAVIKYVLGVGTEHIKLIHIAQDLEPILSTSS